MNPNAIVSEICQDADDFLDGVTKRDEARAGIAEWLTINYAALPPGEKKNIGDEAMRILSEEGFFDRDAGGEI